MGSFDMEFTKSEAEELLEHYGVKGMRWGVRKNPAKSPIKERVSSKYQELSNLKKAHDGTVQNMSKKQLQDTVKRMRQETEFKRLSNSKNISRQARKVYKAQYRRRSRMDEATLKKKLERLRLEDEFGRLASQTSQSDIKKAKSFIKDSAELALNYSTGNSSDYIKTAMAVAKTKKRYS